jgi:CheY-like chemotaxis protein
MENKKTILVVDDEPDLRKVLVMRLLSAGYNTIEAGNGTDALIIAKKEVPSLIILDIMMPKMDGMSLSQQLKDSPTTEKIPLIFLTGLQEKSQESPDHRSGDNIIFSKPYDAKELLDTIKKIIG